MSAGRLTGIKYNLTHKRKSRHILRYYTGVLIHRKNITTNVHTSFLTTGEWKHHLAMKDTDIRVYITVMDLRLAEKKENLNNMTKAEKLTILLRR
jgi:hypothetical protein